MRLNISKRKGGRVYLSIVKDYRNSETKKPTSTVVRSLGYADDLEKEFPDPVAHFKGVAKEMTEAENKRRSLHIAVSMDEELPEDAPGVKNLGYAAPLKVYHELGIGTFLGNKARKEKFEFNAESIMRLLVVERILSPGSKRSAFLNRGRYFERFDFACPDIYRALAFFDSVSVELQRHINGRIAGKWGRDTGLVYYDVTNYYFETSRPDDLRRYGRPKQNRKRPVVQMGMAMDRDGIPLHYELFRGNALDKETFRSVIGEVRKNYGTGRIVAVADMGIVTGDNISYLIGDKPDKPKNGYIFSFSVRGGTDSFKKYVLDGKGYRDEKGEPADEGSTFMMKSRLTPREINVTMTGGSTRKITVHEKQVVTWSSKYAEKAKAERDEILAKARDLIASPSKYSKATSYGAAAYIENLSFDRKTGEIREKDGKQLLLDEAKIKNDEKFDGYYAYVTSETHMGDDEIIAAYSGLWEIEETFKITKSDLGARPVYVRLEDHIDAHFLTCFIALTVLRLMQKRIGREHSVASIIKCLNQIECVHEEENLYLFGYRSSLSDIIGRAFGLDFTKKRLTLAAIKKILGEAKK